jgi:hypothetical protein
MSFHNNNPNNNHNNNPGRKKRRWYYSSPTTQTNNTSTNQEHVNKKAKHSKTPSMPCNIDDERQELLKQYERERQENEKQVSKMEQQLHEYFHKTNTPYSYIDDKGIYNFTPATGTTSSTNSQPGQTGQNGQNGQPGQPGQSGQTGQPGQSGQSGYVPTSRTTTETTQHPTTNPFMNMTFNPFVPSNSVSLFSNTTPFPAVWASIYPIKIVDTNSGVPNVPSTESVTAQAEVKPSTSVSADIIQTIEICEKIEHINDLIALCDKYPLAEDKKYNINMSAIHAIREPLTDLSNMVGMETIKRTIVDQILYYLQELHIPQCKKQERIDNNTTTPSLGSTTNSEEKKPIFNPFASPFPAPFPAPLFESSNTTSSSTSAFPFHIKKNPWANGTSGGSGINDDFALPTKGDFMHTVIYGPPGSGKTEVAKIIGRIFSNLGILNKKIFKKVSRNDLVAGYLGQTAIKTKDMIKASLGGVLFIDEAYSLGNSEKRDSFAKECVDTLCEALSEHKHNWMVIIAGYEKELNDCFFSLNEGLNSRFTWRFKLDAYKPSELKSIYEKQVRDYGWDIANTPNKETDTDVIPESWFASRMDYFTTYGRDMETLFTKTKIAHSRRVFCLPMCEKKIITFADLENGFKLFIENPEVNERKERGSGGPYMKTLYL